MFNIIISCVYILFLVLVNLYAIQKERELLNCKGFTIERQCDEKNSSYFKNALPSNTDTKTMLEEKLINLVSINDNNAYWRKCFILATVISIFAKLFCNISVNGFIALHIVTVGILYFYHNFIDFHINKIAINIAKEIVTRLRKLD